MASSSRSKAVTWGECTAYDTNLEVECDCEEYRQFKNTTLCAECLHEQKKHLAGKASDRSTKDVTSILAGMAKGSSVALGEARLPTRSRIVECEQRQRQGRAKAKAVAKQNSSNMFRVSSIMVLPCGTRIVKGADGELERQLPKNLQAVPDRLESKIGRTGDHDDLMEDLRPHLPHPFAYFERLEAESSEPAWWLATVVGKQLQIAPTSRPTGADAEYNKGASTSGFRHSRLFIVSSQPIPKENLDEWIDTDAIAAQVQPQAGEVVSDSDPESENMSRCVSPSPEPDAIPSRRSKRLSDTQPDDQPVAKRGKRSSSSSNEMLSSIFTDNVAQEIIDDDAYIDLTGNTADDDDTFTFGSAFTFGTGSGSGDSSSALFRPTTPPSKPTPVSLSPEFKVDTTLGDPYAKRTYNFKL
ncbi:hypothetical protein B0H14DRAFT_3521777 [Mycena olivaceomarginata]|nr:hypothetical protein B0H14DRAFT_3521777 [Mycena olivaceomarginata]